MSASTKPEPTKQQVWDLIDQREAEGWADAEPGSFENRQLNAAYCALDVNDYAQAIRYLNQPKP